MTFSPMMVSSSRISKSLQFMLMSQQHLYPSPAPRPVKPSYRIYFQMKSPICVGSERVIWGAKSSRYINSVSVNVWTMPGKRQGIRQPYLAVYAYTETHTRICARVHINGDNHRSSSCMLDSDFSNLSGEETLLFVHASMHY